MHQTRLNSRNPASQQAATQQAIQEIRRVTATCDSMMDNVAVALERLRERKPESIPPPLGGT